MRLRYGRVEVLATVMLVMLVIRGKMVLKEEKRLRIEKKPM